MRRLFTFASITLLLLSCSPPPFNLEDSLEASNSPDPTYAVTYNANGATGGIPPIDSSQYYQGSGVTVLGNTGNLTLAGNTFIGWNTAADGSGTSYSPGANFSMGTANVVLYAVWFAGLTYTVTYNANGATGGTPPIDSNNYPTGANVIAMDNNGNLFRTGFTFAGWNTLANGLGIGYAAGDTFPMGGANVTLWAVWTVQPTYTVTYNANFGPGRTSGSVPIDGNNYLQGAIVTVLSNTGNLHWHRHHFAGWNTAADGSGTGYAPGNTFPMGTANVNLYAVWQ